METKKAQSSDDLVSELLQGVLDDIKGLKQSVSQLATNDAPDYGEELKTLARAVESLKQQPGPASSESNQLSERFSQLEQLIRQKPDYKVSQYVRYGGYVFGLMVMLVAGLTWLALDWKGERDRFRDAYWTADWRVRYLKQQDPNFYNYIEGLFTKDPAGVGQWVVEQEQADEKRALAAQAAEQAKALSDQANQLERKPRVKGKKKG
ncbi:hypothetical protein [Spirosoma spitsbergense]|uniref:hypothetical protein n=1 Tax=Spirosoma spitsbergense TaxID=431554 RepID=UPI000363D424|nr:hypothetical protein [Spirosoma spitsbergense]